MARDDASFREILDGALDGDEQEIDALAQAVRERVYPYLRRITLDEHKAEDLTQETLIAVVKSLEQFRQPDRFWPWVFTIAGNFARQHFRQSRHRTTSMSNIHDPDKLSSPDEADGLAVTSRQELAELTQQAMRRLGERHRMVLALRFYEDMSHGEIAQVMGCTEFYARVLFLRAKRAITQQLKKLGVGRASLLAALMAFGTATLHPSSASAATVSVSSSALAESLVTGLLTGKAKAAVAALALLSAVGTWALVSQRGSVGSGRATVLSGQPAANVNPAILPKVTSMPPPSTDAPLYVHMIHHGRDLGARSGIRPVFEVWLYFPEGVNGPHLISRVPVEEADRRKVNWNVSTAYLDYHVFAASGEVHLENARLYCQMLHTGVLPTDSLEFCAFVEAMDGKLSHAKVNKKGFTFERDPVTGFLTSGVDTRFKDLPPYHTIVEYNPPMQADPFTFVLPAGMKLVDDRDDMHKRGWTYFRVSGQLGGEAISGVGQLPFTYTASLGHPMWLQLQVGKRLVLSDDGRQALVRDGMGAVRFALAGGSFFRGMGRPWEGFHALDQVRRDAATARYGFSTEHWFDAKTAVSVSRQLGNSAETSGASGALYIIDPQQDLLESVKYWQDEADNTVGEIQFTYLDSVENAGEEFAMPESVEAGTGEATFGGTPLWPLDLMSELGMEPAGQPR